MTTADFIREHHARRAGAKWAMSISDDMAEVWDAMINQGKHSWLLWVVTRPGVFQDSTLRRLACRFLRDTPICDGTVWGLLGDRSRLAIELSEAYADGKATEAELAAVYAAARDESDAAYAAAASYATYSSAYAAAWVADAAADAACAEYSAAYTAYAAADAAADAAGAAVYGVPRDADAARIDAAKAAQIRMVSALGNPFKEEPAHD